MPIEDQNLVNAKAQWLNRTFGGVWFPLGGPMNAITTVEYTQTGRTFNPNVGFPVKAFWNQTTGEVKMFDARLFLRPPQN